MGRTHVDPPLRARCTDSPHRAPAHPPHQRPPLQAHRRAACGARARQRTKALQKKYIKKQGQCKPRFSWRERRGKASSRCPVLPPADPRPGPRPIQTPLRGRPPATERKGAVNPPRPRPAPPPPGAGWINKPSAPPVPCPPHSFSSSSPAPLPSPRLQLPPAAPPSAARAPRWP